MAKVVLYTKTICPYCVNAKSLLKRKNVSFEEINLDNNPDELTRIKEELGWKTVPIIVIDGKLIGGYTDMAKLDFEGLLDKLLA